MYGSGKHAPLWHIPDSKVHRAKKGPTWGRQDPVGTHEGNVNLAIRDIYQLPIWMPNYMVDFQCLRFGFGLHARLTHRLPVIRTSILQNQNHIKFTWVSKDDLKQFLTCRFRFQNVNDSSYTFTNHHCIFPALNICLISFSFTFLFIKYWILRYMWVYCYCDLTNFRMIFVIAITVCFAILTLEYSCKLILIPFALVTFYVFIQLSPTPLSCLQNCGKTNIKYAYQGYIPNSRQWASIRQNCWGIL